MSGDGRFFDEVLASAERARRDARPHDGLRILRRDGEHTSLARETVRAALEMDAGAYVAAEERYRRVIARAEELEDRRSLVYARNGLAAVLRRMARFDEAYDLIKTARRLAPGNAEVAATHAAVLRDLSRAAGSPVLRDESVALMEEFGLDAR